MNTLAITIQICNKNYYESRNFYESKLIYILVSIYDDNKYISKGCFRRNQLLSQKNESKELFKKNESKKVRRDDSSMEI